MVSANEPTAMAPGAPGEIDTVAAEQAARPQEEMNALLIGFCAGLTIGLLFLLYIVIATSGFGT